MSPRDRSYDAIGLMKQISEQTAATYANAQEILGDETPKALKKDASGNKVGDQENNDPQNQPGNHSQLASNALVKLDLHYTPADILYPSPHSFIHASFPYFSLQHI